MNVKSLGKRLKSCIGAVPRLLVVHKGSLLNIYDDVMVFWEHGSALLKKSHNNVNLAHAMSS